MNLASRAFTKATQAWKRVRALDDIVASTATGSKTYTNADSGKSFRVSGTATFTDAEDYSDGFQVILEREAGGDITVDGVTADYTMTAPGLVTVKKTGSVLIAVGSDGTQTLDSE